MHVCIVCHPDTRPKECLTVMFTVFVSDLHTIDDEANDTITLQKVDRHSFPRANSSYEYSALLGCTIAVGKLR